VRGTRGRSLQVTPVLADHAAAWDALVEASSLPSPFLRSWWLHSVSAAPGTAHLLVMSDGELVGGLALARDRLLGISRYRFAGQGVLCPDHLDALALPGHEDEVAGALRGWFEAPGQRIVDLSGLREGSLVARALARTPERLDVAPFQALPGDGTDFLAGRSSNFRRSVRKAERRLDEAGVTHRRVEPATLPAALDAFRRLQGDRDGRGPLLDELPVLARALASGLARDEARVDVLETPAEVVAVSLAFVVAGRLSLYQVARSLDHAHRSAATVLLNRVITEALADGCHEVDMLRGDEGYKTSFADARRELFRLRAGHGVLARGLVAGRALGVSAIRRVRRTAGRAGAWRRRRPS
jgi:CelD/BcsL family acetyltransferase involved in cellulose biosynthesis